MITLTYHIDEQEFMRAARAYWSYRGIGDRGNWILAALSLLAGINLLVWDLNVGWIWVGAAALFAVITMIRNALWRRGYRKMIKYTAPITASFTRDVVETTSAEGTSTLPWTTFTKYAETPEFFFLTLPRRGLSIIPKRATKDDWELETLRDMITANLPRAKMRWT
ncbi:YcxB family protein [Litoreibacter janthinus]|uniref:YcxB-like protein n=1 Tax=Litoreibacter janthinus TaxID=670154 RepID=A0A1I6HHE5_9RHOB|nr:YcxB family protein [Litoreibacter janthinus]SFR53896.1 YcxB-like protein [Litoreibacter janthinus]